MIRRTIWAGPMLAVLLALAGCGVPAAPADLVRPPVSWENQESADRFLSELPDNARPLTSVRYGDVDGDGVNEAVVVYEESVSSKKVLKAALFKREQKDWQVVWDTNGYGYGLDYAGIHDVTGDGRPEILLGWSLGASGNGLDIYERENQKWSLIERKSYDGHLNWDTSGGAPL